MKAQAVGGPSSPHSAPWVPGDTWCWVLLCVGDVTVVATAVAICKSKGQCYHRWTVHRMWGERPWRGGLWGEQISQDGGVQDLSTHTVIMSVRAEMIYSTAHARHEVLAQSWVTGCGTHVWAPPTEAAAFLLHHGYIGSVTRGENRTCLLLQLLCHPGERVCCAILCYGCQASHERINMSAVSTAPQVFFQPLSSSLANPAFSEQCTQWETTRQSASQTRSVIQDYCVYFSGKMFFSNTLDAKWPVVWKIP